MYLVEQLNIFVTIMADLSALNLCQSNHKKMDEFPFHLVSVYKGTDVEYPETQTEIPGHA